MDAMGSFSIWHWMLFGAVALLLFGGKGKISDIMGDVAKGIKSFKKGMSEDDEPVAPGTPVTPAARTIETRAPVAPEPRENQKVG
jgi:sec-independent protein translocase protein TatA